MRSSIASRVGAAAVLLLLASFTSACAADPAPPAGGGSPAASSPPADSASDADAADDGRAFGSSDDAVIQAVEQTLSSQNAKAEWAGSTLTVHLDGSVDEVMATIPCRALDALISADEDAVIVYADGEVRCSDHL